MEDEQYCGVADFRGRVSRGAERIEEDFGIGEAGGRDEGEVGEGGGEVGFEIERYRSIPMQHDR